MKICLIRRCGSKNVLLLISLDSVCGDTSVVIFHDTKKVALHVEYNNRKSSSENSSQRNSKEMHKHIDTATMWVCRYKSK